MKWLDDLLIFVPILMTLIALLIAFAVGAELLALRQRGSRIRRCGDTAPADPFYFPFGEMPIVPRERHLIVSDFRAWRIPLHRRRISASAPLRNEDGGRSVPSGSAVVLTFRRRKEGRNASR